MLSPRRAARDLSDKFYIVAPPRHSSIPSSCGTSPQPGTSSPLTTHTTCHTDSSHRFLLDGDSPAAPTGVGSSAAYELRTLHSQFSAPSACRRFSFASRRTVAHRRLVTVDTRLAAAEQRQRPSPGGFANSAIANNILLLHQLRRLLAHQSSQRAAENLPAVFKLLAARGLRGMTVRELLGALTPCRSTTVTVGSRPSSKVAVRRRRAAVPRIEGRFASLAPPLP